VKDVTVQHTRKGLAVPLLISIDFTPDPHQPSRFTSLMRVRKADGHHELESHLGLSARLDAMSRIISSVAHEIKNPLNSIAVRLDNLQAWATSGFPQAEEEIQGIVQEVNRLDRVVRTFLDFTRPVELRQENVDIGNLVRGVATLLEQDARRRSIRISFSGPLHPLCVLGDEDLLTEAVINVATNAIEAMPHGGTLTMAVKENGEQCSITIADTGAGIPESQREKIFELYFTSKKNGSGLGLPMAFRAIQLHGGAIDLESEPGQGATFQLNLPIIVDEARKH
jgi:signal transduction histidine kinase